MAKLYPIISKKLSYHKNIKHGFFTRNGGFSNKDFHSLNCSLSSGDNLLNVNKNREIVCRYFNKNIRYLKTVQQIHSNKVVVISDTNHINSVKKADSIITKIPNIILGILTADCAPILLFDYKSKIIAAIHVGWKGAKSKIISSTINEMCKIGGKRSSILAAIGPCIGKNSYEVGEDLYEDFKNINLNYIKYFSSFKINKFLFNLPELILSQLVEEKINIKNISKCTNDTYTDEKKFFSHRRNIKTNSKSTGRMISAISII